MSNKLLDQRTAEKIKSILKLAQTFVFKDETKANSYESENSIIFSSCYIEALEGNLEYIEKYEKKGFPSILNEFNLIDDGADFYIRCYRKNSLYVGNDIKRYREVRGSSALENKSNSDANFQGNIFELNDYYRNLYIEHDIDPYKSRKAENYDILFYDEDYIPADFDIQKFLSIYKECRNLFTRSLENVAFRWDTNILIFNTWTITIMSIFAYIDDELQKAFNVDMYDTYDIRNALYSYGITFLNGLPVSYQLRVIKNIRQLIRSKATSSVFDVIVKEIFGQGTVDVYKYYLIRRYASTEDLNEKFEKGEISIEDIRKNSDVMFVRVPYDVNDIEGYIKRHPDAETYSYDEIVSKDSKYWKAGSESEIRDNPDLKNLSIIQTKYIDVNSVVNLNQDIEGLMLLFAMLHANKNLFKISTAITTFDTSATGMSLFQALVVILHINAIINGSDPDFGYAINGDYLVSVHSYYNAALSALNKKDALALYNIRNKPYPMASGESWNAENSFTFRFANSSEPTNINASSVDIERLKDGMNEDDFADWFESTILAIQDSKFLFSTIDEDNDWIGSLPHKIEKDENGNPVIKEFNTDLIEDGLSVKTRNQIGSLDYLEDDPDTARYLVNKNTGIYISSNTKFDGGLDNLVEMLILRNNINDSFESHGKATEKDDYPPFSSFGYPTDNYESCSSSGEYLKKYLPAVYNKIINESKDNVLNLRNIFNSFIGDLMLYLEKIGISSYVSFGGYSKNYLSVYATKLIEKFASYTVQLRATGEEIRVDDKYGEKLNTFDRLSQESSKCVILTDCFGRVEPETEDDYDSETSEIANTCRVEAMDRVAGAYASVLSGTDAYEPAEALYARIIVNYETPLVPREAIDYNYKAYFDYALLCFISPFYGNSSTPRGDYDPETLEEICSIGMPIPQHAVDIEDVEFSEAIISEVGDEVMVSELNSETTTEVLTTEIDEELDV